MMTKRTGFLAKAMMALMALFMLVPAVSAQDNYGQWRRQENWRRQEQRRREREEMRRQRQAQRRDARDVDGDGDYDQRDAYIIQQRQRSGGYYGNNGGYYGNGTYSRRGYGYGGNGYYSQSQQTALNAGYNEGVKEGRRDRSRGGYRNVNDFSAYRNADKDYNSRYGDRYEYQMYFRRGFENGYNDGLNGY